MLAGPTEVGVHGGNGVVAIQSRIIEVVIEKPLMVKREFSLSSHLLVVVVVVCAYEYREETTVFLFYIQKFLHTCDRC